MDEPLDSATDSQVLLERQGEIVTITLNRPEARNAVSFAMLQRLDSMLDDFARESPRVVILQAASPGFCAGIDLKESREATVDLIHRRVALMHHVLHELRYLPVPVIVAVDGVCAGLGSELAISGDIRLASPTSRFSYPEVKVAVPSPAHHLIALVGLGRAQEMLLTGRWVDAVDAEGIGLVTRIVDSPEAEAQTLAREICDLAPVAVAKTKENMLLSMSAGADVATHHHISGVTSAAWTRDRQEALAAFAERRKPRFDGS